MFTPRLCAPRPSPPRPASHLWRAGPQPQPPSPDAGGLPQGFAAEPPGRGIPRVTSPGSAFRTTRGGSPGPPWVGPSPTATVPQLWGSSGGLQPRLVTSPPPPGRKAGMGSSRSLYGVGVLGTAPPAGPQPRGSPAGRGGVGLPLRGSPPWPRPVAPTSSPGTGPGAGRPLDPPGTPRVTGFIRPASG